MLRTLLGLDQTQQIAGIDVYFSSGWITALLAPLLLAGAVALVVYLYVLDRRLHRGYRIVMGACLSLALLLMIAVMRKPVADIELRQPYNRTLLVLLDSSRSMSLKDERTKAEEVGDAATVLGELPLGDQLNAGAVDSMRQRIGEVSRFDLAKAALAHPEIDFLGKLNDQYQARFFSFDRQLQPEGGAENPSAWLADRKAEGDASLVGSAIEEAVARYSGQSVAGVVVLSDFAWADGRDPVQVAKTLKKRGIPVYPVAIGLPAPPDVNLRRVNGPEVVFKGDRVPLRLQIESHGFAGANVELELLADGKQVISQQVELVEGVQFEEMTFKPERDSGTVELELRTTVLNGETSADNNTVAHKVKILDEKIKVLYIEGMPRWEYRYLRRVLLRDVQLDVTFLMTQGDPALGAASPNHLSRFPKVKKDAFKYDLIILGDVPASYFNDTQMELIEDLVRSRSGSLLMVAGSMGAPATYGETPIADMLPVELGNGQWYSVAVSPLITLAGQESPVTTLSTSPELNARIWSRVPPMYLPVLEGAKPGATVLLTTPRDPQQSGEYPLVAWQRYGEGKCMFVATDDLWRMRLEVGDKYHAAFWGQTIKFLTLSRLAGGNKPITLETDRSTYSAGEQVRIFADVLTPAFEPVVEPSFTVVVDRKERPDETTEIELSPVPDSPGVYSGVHLAGEDGVYQLKTRPEAASISNKVDFEIATVALEDRETAMRDDVAREIAELSGGKSLGLPDLAGLPDELGEQEALTKEVRLQLDLWDSPILFVFMVLLAGTEWFMRRRNSLV